MATGDIKGFADNGFGVLNEVTIQGSAADILAGTDNSKIASAKNLKDAEFIAIHIGTSAPADTSKLWIDTN